jgi:hypothetical protein
MEEFAKDKKIDEAWKQAAEKEKNEQADFHQEAGFGGFISGLAMQALVFLGEIPDPLNNQKKLDLKQAGYLIDTLAMLQKKTRGNLSSEESANLDSFIYQLRMKYVEKNKG